MELDPDMVALRTTGAFANGDQFEKDDQGRFPHFVVKEIDPALVENSSPHHHFTNANDVEPVEGTHVVYLSPNDKPGYVRSEQRFHGTFFQVMQLAAFPFDAQTLKITIRLPRRSDWGRSFVQFHNSIGPQAEMKDWVRLAEWYRYEPDAEATVDSKGRAKYTISVPLVRRYTYYVWSILAVIGSISFLSFVSFAINPDDLPGRSSLVVTLLLTAVAFKLVISDILPKVSYWTCMDYYINAMFCLLLIISIENGMVGLVANRAEHLFEAWGNIIEIGTAAGVFLLWVAFHVWFVRHVIAVRAVQTEHLKGSLTGSAAAKKRFEELEAERKRRSILSSQRSSSSLLLDEAPAAAAPAPAPAAVSSNGYTQLQA